MSEFAVAEHQGPCDDSDECCLCSFAVSGESPMHQAIYHCETCWGDDERCCCIGCVNICHAGHDVNFIAFGDGFCDCGRSGCGLSDVSKTEAQRLVDTTFQLHDPELKELTSRYSPVFSVHEMKSIDSESDIIRLLALSLVGQNKDTHWVAQDAEPRCLFESLAKTIGTHHLNQQFRSHPSYEDILKISGFEWWVQVKPSDSQNVSAVTNRGVVGVDLHYDKDEEMASSFELGVFPMISTVTYVTNSEEYCHPTVVLDCTAASPVGAPIRNAFFALPQVGKHVAFDGRLLHGAPSELLPFTKMNRKNVCFTAAERITFLVNVWIGHRPAAVTALNDSVVLLLNDVHKKHCLSMGRDCSNFRSNVTMESISNFHGQMVRVKEIDTQRDDLGDWLSIPFVSNNAEWGKSEDETGLDLAIWVPSIPVSQFLDLTCAARKRRAENQEADVVKPHVNETFSFQFVGDNAAARLDYEDEEGEDGLVDELEQL